MSRKDLGQSVTDFAHDNDLMQKTRDSAALRAKRRARDKRLKLARRKRLKEILFFTLYGFLLLFFTAVVGQMVIKIM